MLSLTQFQKFFIYALLLAAVQLALMGNSLNQQNFSSSQTTIQSTCAQKVISSQTLINKNCPRLNSLQSIHSNQLFFSFFMGPITVFYLFDRILFYPALINSIFKPPEM